MSFRVSRCIKPAITVQATTFYENRLHVKGNSSLGHGATGAMLDRLTHRVHIVEANGESYRLRDSQQRIRRKRMEKTED